MGVGNGVARNAGLTNTNVHSLTVSGTSLAAGTSGGIFITKKGERSADSGRASGVEKTRSRESGEVFWSTPENKGARDSPGLDRQLTIQFS